MTMNPGTRMGSYEIVAPLGVGGMGEVYRARDTKLGREVAIKVLPETFAADPERLARFEREARLLASLNHHGIAHLYGFEAATLEEGRRGHFLVMELAEGEDLAERLKRGAIPVDEALAIAKQIAEALEEAHEKGIVHRDLKPANVKLAPDGSREAEMLVEGERGHIPSSFSPDGRALIYDALRPDATARDIWMLPLDGPRRPSALVAGAFMKSEGVLSPDGRWLAYVSDEGGQASVFVRPFPTGDGRWQISTPSGSEPRWSHDGRELFYRVDAALYRVPVETARSFSAGRPERRFDRVASGAGAYTYSPTPDGSRFLTFRSSEGVGSLRTLYLDLGFAARLKALATKQ